MEAILLDGSTHNGPRTLCGWSPTAIERGVLVVTGLIVWTLLNWTFQDLALLLYALLSVVFLLVTARSSMTRRVLGILGIALAGWLAMEASVLFPLSNRLDGVSFRDAPLPQVLHHLARQGPYSGQPDPGWRFLVWDEAAAQARVTVDLPNGCRLGEALDRVARASGTVHRWSWHKSCGNESRPLVIEIDFWRPPLPTDRWDAILLIEGDGLYLEPRAAGSSG